MFSWLGQLDPNLVVGLFVSLAAFVYHQFSPATQAKMTDAAQSALQTTLQIADEIMSGIVAASPPGTTREMLQHELWSVARVQLKHLGLDPDKLPPAVEAAVNGLVSKWLASFKAPLPTAIVAGTAK